MWLLFKNLLFTVFVPGFLGVWVPLRYIVREPRLPARWTAYHLAAAPVVQFGVMVYAWCVWDYARYCRTVRLRLPSRPAQ